MEDLRLRNKRSEQIARSLFIPLAALVLSIVMAVFMGFCFSNELKIRVYSPTSDKPVVRILQISDLHDDFFGEGNRLLLDEIEKIKPDIVVFTGDMTEPEKKDRESMNLLMRALSDKYHCYYVSGNHELAGDFEAIKREVRENGVRVLNGEVDVIEVNGKRIAVGGLDSYYTGKYLIGERTLSWQEQLDLCKAQLKNAKDGVFSVLLSHRPDLVDVYKESGFDLVLCGHAHGGQFRIPGILNGLYAPNQGIFPKYAGGTYALGDTVMIVSRGLCKSRFPRLFNNPELVVIDV